MEYQIEDGGRSGCSKVMTPGLLNGQTTKQDSIPSEEGLFTLNMAGVKDRGRFGS
jgi:hypothetical protein